MRLNVEVTEVQDQLIRELVELSGARSKTVLINYALTFLAWGLREAHAGKMIASVDERNDRYTELQMPPFHNAASRGEAARAKAEAEAVAKAKAEAEAKARAKAEAEARAKAEAEAAAAREANRKRQSAAAG